MQTNYTIKIQTIPFRRNLTDNRSLNSDLKMSAKFEQQPTQRHFLAEKELPKYPKELRRHLLSLSDNFLKPGVFPWEKSNRLLFKLQKVRDVT